MTDQPQLFPDPTVRAPERKKITCTPNAIGTGPDGETCKTCHHKKQVRWHGKTYYKCGLMQKYWTHGSGSDIKLKWAACESWEPGWERHLWALNEFREVAGKDYEPTCAFDWRLIADWFAEQDKVGEFMACLRYAEALELGKTGG